MVVLIIGYGKIGKIKADIWHSLGRRVVVYDIDPAKRTNANNDGYKLFQHPDVLDDDLIVDISTPATLHLHSIKWVYDILGFAPRIILVEKPLVSTAQEMAEFKDFLINNPRLREKIVVNESYYLSTALEHVVNLLQETTPRINSVRVELSKNRLDDIFFGRFTDPHLGSLGIELPHMIALLQSLGMNLADLDLDYVKIFTDTNDQYNEGFRIQFNHSGTRIVLESYLGDFRVEENDSIIPNKVITRKLEIATDDMAYSVEFDPVPNIERYKSRIITSNSNTRDDVIMADNHLACHLRHLHSARSSLASQYLDASNATAVAELIFMLKDQADYCNIIRPASNSI